ncbi:MAG: tRNA pseudouridine(38-40) synthase TruA [Acidobacteriota bacterium]
MRGRNPRRQTRQPVERERNLRLLLAFDGAAYHGWQIQKKLPTIQGALQDAIRGITGEDVNLIGSGRTDAGAHARGMVASFKTRSRIGARSMVRALNSRLPGDIRILSAREAPANFHARYSARAKIYRYQIYRGEVLPPHLAGEYFHYPYPVDVPRMEEAAPLLEGTRDFASFAAVPRHSAAGSADERRGERSTVRTVHSCRLACRGKRMTLSVEGSGFLHHMVRNMAGTLLEVGRGRITLRELQDLFRLRDRSLAGFTAPAHALILMKVRY